MGEGEGGMIWENGIETCIISYMKRIASPGSMHDTGCLGLVHWDAPEGWYGEGQPTPVFLPGESQGQGAWWAAVYGVAQSRTRLKRLSSSSNLIQGSM